MNQKEEITKTNGEIKKLKAELSEAKKLFKTHFSNAKAERDRIYSEIEHTYNKLKELKMAFVSPVTSDPKLFAIDNYSHLVSQELKQKAREMNVSPTTSSVWGLTISWFNSIPYVQQLDAHIKLLWDRIQEIETAEYKALTQKIDDLTRQIKWKETFLNNVLLDIGRFRAYAKETKEREEQQLQEKQEEENLNKFKTWFEKTYKQSLIDSINSIINETNH